MPAIGAVAVYCGSRHGADPAFAEAARTTGGTLARRGIAVVYGGGSVGLMGIVADAALEAGGEVHGVITRALLDKELQHRELTSLAVVETMHERKAAMADRADAFVALPGGFGTFDELFEVITWTQLGIHDKPCGILDVNGFFGPLVGMMDDATAHGFVRPEHRRSVLVDTSIGVLLDRMLGWSPVGGPGGLDRGDR